jgi:hypothetical protein
MSTEWAGLSGDAALREIQAGPSLSTPRDRDPDAGAWPEDLDTRFYASSSMSIPGKGSPGENCGEWFPQEFCDECGEPHLGRSRCEQRTCPSCWSSWTRRRAEKITRRLGSARYAAEDGLRKRAVHAVVSAPEGEIRTLSDVQQGYRDAYRLAQEKGVRGGVAVFHGFRVTDDGKALYEAAKAAGTWDEDEDGRLWSFVRRHELRIERGIGGGDWRDLSYWSPHWHILGLAEEFEADDPDAQEGWIARRIRSLESFKLHEDAGYEDMVGASMYLLSHATFETDSSKDCLRWFGELATTKFSPEEELSEGSLSVVERKAREAAQSGRERGEEEVEEEECGNCGATSRSPIWDAGAALMDPGWCDRIGREQQRRLTAAFEWAIGERQPPPGMKHPKSEKEAEEALTALL